MNLITTAILSLIFMVPAGALIKSQKTNQPVIPNVKIEGTVVKYNKHTVTLKQTNGQVTVPRNHIPSHYKLRTGQKVHAISSGQELMKHIKKAAKKAAKKTNQKAAQKAGRTVVIKASKKASGRPPAQKQ